MYITILKLLSPYLQRHAAKKAAQYLRARRERRLAEPLGEPLSDSASHSASIDESTDESTRNETGQAFSANEIWFALSGILLGGVFGYVLAYLTNRKN